MFGLTWNNLNIRNVKEFIPIAIGINGLKDKLMKNQSFLSIAILFSISAFSQQTRVYSDPESTFKEAKEYFQKEQYSLAYPLFKEL